jgi:hypothetical protein
LAILVSLLVGNALSVLGGIDLVEHVYHTVHKVHPFTIKVVSYVKSTLQHFKLFKVKDNGVAKKSSMYDIGNNIANQPTKPTTKPTTITITRPEDTSTSDTDVHETKLD